LRGAAARPEVSDVRPATILALTLVSCGLVPLACAQDFNFFAATQGTGGSSATGSGTGASEGSSSGSRTGCLSNSDCDDMNGCTTDTCNPGTGACSHTPVADGSLPIGYTDTVKDCKTDQCMSGMVQTIADDTDVPPSSNPCVTNSCANQMVVMTDVASGQSCGPNNQTCDGMGNCVGCNTKSDCPAPGACKTVACTNRKCVVSDQATGAACTASTGKVCDGAGNCVACNTASDCGGAACQNNMCTTKGMGQACTDGTQCTSGHCVSGFCCDSGCTGTCQACSNTLTGAANGHCALIKGGTTAPAGQCTPNPPCGNTGNCTTFGTCEVPSASTPCGAPTCTAGVETPAGTCDGTSKCVQQQVSCGAYACMGTACATTCTTSEQCNKPVYGCDMNNHCLLASGQPCTMGTQCVSATCAVPDGGALDGGSMVCQ
jgi:hypothetical protein